MQTMKKSWRYVTCGSYVVRLGKSRMYLFHTQMRNAVAYSKTHMCIHARIRCMKYGLDSQMVFIGVEIRFDLFKDLQAHLEDLQ